MKNITLDDWHVTDLAETVDGYLEYEVRCDKDWYTARGTVSGNEVTLDEIIVGHSGHSHQRTVTPQLERWFGIHCSKAVLVRINERIISGHFRKPDDVEVE